MMWAIIKLLALMLLLLPLLWLLGALVYGAVKRGFMKNSAASLPAAACEQVDHQARSQETRDEFDQVLAALAEGAATEEEIRARLCCATLDLDFFLKRGQRDGLVIRRRDKYELTEKGRERLAPPR